MALEESLKLTDKANEMQEIEAQMLDLVSKEVFSFFLIFVIFYL